MSQQEWGIGTPSSKQTPIENKVVGVPEKYSCVGNRGTNRVPEILCGQEPPPPSIFAPYFFPPSSNNDFFPPIFAPLSWKSCLFELETPPALPPPLGLLSKVPRKKS